MTLRLRPERLCLLHRLQPRQQASTHLLLVKLLACLRHLCSPTHHSKRMLTPTSLLVTDRAVKKHTILSDSNTYNKPNLRLCPRYRPRNPSPIRHPTNLSRLPRPRAIIPPITAQLSSVMSIKLLTRITMVGTVRVKMSSSARVVRLDPPDKTHRASMPPVGRSQLMANRKRRIVATIPLILQFLVSKPSLPNKCTRAKVLRLATHMATPTPTVSNTRNTEHLT